MKTFSEVGMYPDLYLIEKSCLGGRGNGKAGWTSNAQITSNKNTKIQVPEVRNTGGNSIILINI